MSDMTRRLMLAAGVGFGLAGTARELRAADASSPTTRAWDFTFPSLEDGILNLADYRGRVLLVVNTASFCGFTYQYEGLEKLHAELSPRGLTVVGVPSQDFHQEKDSNGEVKDFCEATFGVRFPMTGITHVRGDQAHPFYTWVKLTQNWEPQWNFNKVLIARDGTIAGHYGSLDEPNGPLLSTALDRQLRIA